MNLLSGEKTMIPICATKTAANDFRTNEDRDPEPDPVFDAVDKK